MIRFLTAGESHGPGLVTIVEGLPKGLTVSAEALSNELSRRRHGYGRGDRMKIEQDAVEIIGGVRHGETLGSPVAVVVRNTEWPKWQEVMAVEGVPAGAPVVRPRPGHADLAGMLKYDTGDARDILERASARETAARAVVGYLSKVFLSTLGIGVFSHVRAIGGIQATVEAEDPQAFDAVDRDPVRSLDPVATEKMVQAIDKARDDKDSLGGVFEVVAFGVPAGIGSHVQHDRRLDTRLAGAIMSIPAIKGVEIGDGFALAGRRGSMAHDEIVADGGELGRLSNRAGGVEGGMSNGQPIRVSAAMKPLSTLMSPLQTVDMSSGDPAQAVRERSDVCAVPAAAVVGEHMTAFVLAMSLQEKFGGDTLRELKAAFGLYVERLSSALES